VEAVGESGPLEQHVEPALDEVRAEAVEVVIPELVDGDDNDQARALGTRRSAGRGVFPEGNGHNNQSKTGQ
jgi:hypothetical protein